MAHRLALLALTLVAAPAQAQVCASCWAKACPELASYLPPCASEATTPPRGTTALDSRPSVPGTPALPATSPAATGAQAPAATKLVGTSQPAVAGPGCPSGQVVPPGVSGKCCWPGQSWDQRRRACKGTASCSGRWTIAAGGAACEPADCELPEGSCCHPGRSVDLASKRCGGQRSDCARFERPSADGANCVPRVPSCPDGMAGLPGGSFVLGESKRSAVVEPYCLAVTETTVEEFAACVAAGRCSKPSGGFDCNWGAAGRTNHPVNCVSEAQAVTYCAWSKGRRLPSEEEWEWAARGGEAGTRFPWGNGPLEKQACWLRDSSQSGTEPYGTCPVGRFRSGDSPHGLKDLAGNVWEYTSSTEGGRTVKRGGAWGEGSRVVFEASYRRIKFPTPESQVGFRCATEGN